MSDVLSVLPLGLTVEVEMIPDARQAIRLLSDQPIVNDDSDRLGYSALADAFADVIDDPRTETPLTMAVTGSWGTGKTSFSRLVEQRLGVVHSWRRPHLVCRFDAWLHEDAPSLGVALASAVAVTANRHRPWWRKLVQPVSVRMITPQHRWRRTLNRVTLAVLLAVAAALLPWSREVAVEIAKDAVGNKPTSPTAASTSTLGVTAVLVLIWVLARRLFAATTALSRFFGSPRDEAATGTMNEVRTELGMLIKQALRGQCRLIVMVDDLDRCTGDRALQVGQIATKLLDHPQVVVLLIGDTDQLSLAAARQLAAPQNTPDDAARIGRRYLEKLIQVELPLPRVHRTDVRGLVDARSSFHTISRQPKTWRSTWAATSSWVADLSVRRVITYLSLGLAAVLVLRGFGRSSISSPGAADNVFDATLFIMADWIVGPSGRTIATLAILIIVTGALMGRVSWGMAVIISLSFVIIWGFSQALSAEGLTTSGGAGRDVFAVTGGLLIFFFGLRPVRGRRTQRQEAAILDYIRTAANEGATVDQIQSRLVGRFGTADTMRRRIDRFVADESSIATAANTAMVKPLPENPRTAKRIMSKLRLMLVVAVGRGLFDEGSTITADHLAKWVALTERWPMLSELAAREPEFIRTLEASDYRELHDLIKEYADSNQHAHELREFIVTGPPLFPVLDKLIHIAMV